MLEVRFNLNTGEVTGWWGNRHGNRSVKLNNRPDEALAYIDISVPDKPLGAWLCDGTKLTPNPDYVEPEPPRNLAAGVDKLIVWAKARGFTE